MIESVLGETGALVRLAMDASMLRHQTIAANIANAENPNYQPLRVNFEEQFNAYERSNSNEEKNLSLPKPFVEIDNENVGQYSPKVFVDMEIVKLNINTLHFQALAKAVSKQMALTHLAISEGKS